MKQIITILFLCVCILDVFGRNNSRFAVESNLSSPEAFQSLYIDSVPLIFIEAPLDQSVATPFLPVKAWCQDSSGCRLRISINSPFDTASINFVTGDMVDTVLDLSGFNNLGVVFSIEAISLGGDSAKFSQWRNIYVDASHSLKQVFAGGDQILDFNYNKVLVSSPLTVSPNAANPFIHRSRIMDISTGDSIVIPNENSFVSGNLSKYGAVFNALVPDTTPTSFNIFGYDWNNGSLYTLGQATPSESLQISGDYAIWAYDSAFYLRNLQTLQNNFITSSAAVTSYNCVTSNGVVVYAYADPSKQPLIYIHPPGIIFPDSIIAIPDPNNPYPNTNIVRYSNNISSAITNDSYNYNYGPLTDGNRIVYTKADTCCMESNPSLKYHIHVNNGQTDSVISDIGIEPPFPIRQYQIANGFIAFTKPDSAGHLQIWLMDSLGKSSQITFSGNFNTIELLNDRGDMIFTSAIDVPNYGIVTKRLFANRATKKIIELCSGNGHAFYRDSTWYVVMGRMLYSIDIVGSPLVITEAAPIISGLDSIYCKNQGMQKIKILNLPDTTKGTSVRVLLDSTSLAIAPDSSFSFTPSNLSADAHVIKVLYIYSDNTRILDQIFTVRDLAKPELTLSANTGIVTSSSAPVIITATNKSGGGTSPTYTFAKDRNLINILQPEGTSNFLNIDPTSLNMGVNQIYVRMKTSDSCYAFQTNTDSIQIVKNSTTGIIDLDFPNQTITNFPNPSSQYMTITGINSSKTYLFIIRNELGENVNQVQVGSANTTNLYIGNLKSDNYWLTVFDYNKNKLIGTIPFIKY